MKTYLALLTAVALAACGGGGGSNDGGAKTSAQSSPATETPAALTPAASTPAVITPAATDPAASTPATTSPTTTPSTTPDTTAATPDTPASSTPAVAASIVVTFFTFLPSFLFILLGGPFIETTHGNLKFTAPLTAITSAVVGVIVNLAVFFAIHVLWPHSMQAGFEWPALLIGVAAGIALFRFKIGVIPVVLTCGVVGLVMRLLVP